MIKSANLKVGENVLEIGPGRGALTKELLRAGAKVFAVEKDRTLGDFLKDRFKEELDKGQLKLLIKDINDLEDKDLKALVPYKLLANIPYYITGDILRMFLSMKHKPESMTILVQKEVAQRVVSSKESILSLSVKFYGIPKLIKKVSSKCFLPQPKVDSAILHIALHSTPPHKVDERDFFNVIHTGFAAKRKKLLNNLASKYNKEILMDIFEKFSIGQNTRAEELDLDKWIEITKALYK
jgi:16S rRNA (adenine1518-N6/adenine1519-N6)-dimethyltransferase